MYGITFSFLMKGDCCKTFKKGLDNYLKCGNGDHIKIKAAWVDQFDCHDSKGEPKNAPNLTKDISNLCNGNSLCTFPFVTTTYGYLIVNYTCDGKI